MTDGRQQLLARGVYAALATPRRPNSIEADTAVMLDYLDQVASTGVNGVVLFGATGEFIHFELEERIRVTGLAIKRSRVPVLVNVSHSTLAGAVAIASGAKEAGASGLLLTPPYFYRYSDDQICEFFRQFVQLAGRDAPIYLYNLPMFVNPISAELAKRLFENVALAGIKDSSGDWGLFESLLALRAGHGFQLLAGNESIYLRARLAGADGAVSGVAAALPELMVALERALEAGDGGRAQNLNASLREFLAQVHKLPATVAIREAAQGRGWKLSQAAIPFDKQTSTDIEAFHGWFRGWFPELLRECGQSTGVRT